MKGCMRQDLKVCDTCGHRGVHIRKVARTYGKGKDLLVVENIPVVSCPHLDYSQDLVLITFWERGRKVKTVALRDIVPDKSTLKRTVSHYHWGNINGVNERNQLLVKRADGREYRFNMATGVAE